MTLSSQAIGAQSEPHALPQPDPQPSHVPHPPPHVEAVLQARRPPNAWAASVESRNPERSRPATISLRMRNLPVDSQGGILHKCLCLARNAQRIFTDLPWQ